MKVLIIIVVIIIVILVVFQSFTLLSANNTEEQKYTVISKENGFEIRFYPAATMATINSTAKSYKELSGPGFRQLAGYIFGGNAGETQISMTAPVHMTVIDSGSTMSFVMPTGYNESNLPKPNNPGVIIKKSSEEYVAVIRFGGYASDDDLKFYSEKLESILKEKGITTYGHYRYLGYNPPYQVINRRNEIIVSIKWN
jgi:hypothetical protein